MTHNTTKVISSTHKITTYNIPVSHRLIYRNTKIQSEKIHIPVTVLLK